MAFRYDIGTLLIATVVEKGKPVPLPGDTVAIFRIQKPNGTVLTKTATIVGDGSSGQVQYVIVEGDLDSTGTYYFQGKVSFDGGSWSSGIQAKKIEDTLHNRV